MIISSLCERIAELNVAEARLCLDHNSHVPQMVIKISNMHKPFPILFCANMLQRLEFSALYKSQLTQKAQLCDAYKMLNLKQPWFSIAFNGTVEEVKHLISSCYVSMSMMSFVDKKKSATNKQFVKFEELVLEAKMKSIFTEYSYTVIDKRQKSLDLILKQFSRTIQADQINWISKYNKQSKNKRLNQ